MDDESTQLHTPENSFLTTKEIKEGCIDVANGDDTEARVCVINQEFKQGFEFIEQFEKSVTFWGSARLAEDHHWYKQVRTLSSRIASELGYTIVTGGGPGVMEAANRGAYEVGGTSVGLTIQLPMEQTTNPYVTHELPFYFFFSRKVTLTYAAEAYVFCPGGFGTLDELFEILTLIQTGKIGHVPVILYGSDYWQPLDTFIKTVLKDSFETISPEDIDLYTICDDMDDILAIVKDAPIRTE